MTTASRLEILLSYELSIESTLVRSRSSLDLKKCNWSENYALKEANSIGDDKPLIDIEFWLMLLESYF